MRTTGTYWSTIERVDGVRKRLKALQDQMAPLIYACEQDVLIRYKAVRRSAKAIKINE